MYQGQNDRGYSRPPSPKIQGNWTCGLCGAAITELPFQPNENRLKELKCFDCHKKSLGERGGGGFRGGNGGGGYRR